MASRLIVSNALKVIDLLLAVVARWLWATSLVGADFGFVLQWKTSTAAR
jgi:hypothetical protein